MRINNIQTKNNTPSFGQVISMEATNQADKVAIGEFTNRGKLFSYQLRHSTDAESPKYSLYAKGDKETFAAGVIFGCDEKGVPKDEPFYLSFPGGDKDEYLVDSRQIIDAYRNGEIKPSDSSALDKQG